MAAREGQPVTTLEELRTLPEDGLRHELLDGVHVVTPSPRPVHQVVLDELAAWMREALASAIQFRALCSPSDIQLSGRTLVQPDLFVVSWPAGLPPASWRDLELPILVVEILSPGTALRDRGIKREPYQAAGIAEYWIVDIDARLIERWTPEDDRPEIARDLLRWNPPNAEVVADLDVASFFRRAWGEVAEA